MNAISATELVVIKDKQTILDKISFDIHQGTVTGLIGPSGSGKTTLMRTIVGVQKYKGSLMVLGNKAGNKYLRTKIGYVSQNPSIYTDLTVRQNINYFAAITGATKTDVKNLIKVADLIPQINQLAGSLSGGQKARVSLMIALLSKPDLLILDEPTVGLDPILRNNLWALFARLAKDGQTLLVSSHVMDEAERCDQLLLLREGKLLWHDDKQALLEHTATKNIGEAFVNIIEEQK